jgi:hypothetical protein
LLPGISPIYSIACARVGDYHFLHLERWEFTAESRDPAWNDYSSSDGGFPMKAACKVLLGLAMVCTLAVMTRAAEDKEVTLKGTVCCSKCSLKETAKCGNAIKVKEGDKEIVYYFIDKGGKEGYHKDICQETKAGSVKGTVSEKDGKKYITPAKEGVKFD